MDMDIEREELLWPQKAFRNVAGVKINIIDTPVMLISEEVERALMMVDGAILLVFI
jgi:predicted membrane GTPase involved in stress response